VQGSIRRRGPDSWQVRVSLGRDHETGRYRYVGRYDQGRSGTPNEPLPSWSQKLTGAGRLDMSHVTFHSLRHFTATTLAAGGVGIRDHCGPARARQVSRFHHCTTVAHRFAQQTCPGKVFLGHQVRRPLLCRLAAPAFGGRTM
jgi:integrase